jgi:hypothetical protein
MDTIIKVFAGLFMTLFLTFTGTGLIASSMNANKAERFASDSAVRIGNSNYSRSVIDSCREDAEKSGYSLDVKLSERPGSRRVEYGTLTLSYPYSIPLIGVNETHFVEEDIL